jgi:hypothetical protein
LGEMTNCCLESDLRLQNSVYIVVGCSGRLVEEDRCI